MPSNRSRNPQVNVALSDSEEAELLAICAKEHIRSPATLAGIWIRENLRQHSSVGELMAVVLEAQKSGVDVLRVLAKAKRAKR